MTDYLILIIFGQHFNSQTLTLIAFQHKPKLAKEATNNKITGICIVFDYILNCYISLLSFSF